MDVEHGLEDHQCHSATASGGMISLIVASRDHHSTRPIAALVTAAGIPNLPLTLHLAAAALQEMP
jgi:hypothetical protein